jgi:hypothetical protein
MSPKSLVAIATACLTGCGSSGGPSAPQHAAGASSSSAGSGTTSASGAAGGGPGGSNGQVGGGPAAGGPAGGGLAGALIDPIPSMHEPGSCGLEQPAFCEKFDRPLPGGRGGDLDESVWSYARYGHPSTLSFFLRGPFSTNDEQAFPARFCGAPFSNIMPGEDVKFCQGMGVDGTMSSQLNEVLDDEGDFGFNSMRIRQPFDFTGREGKIVLDVDAKVNPRNLGHGWWIEVWITEDPVPMPYHNAPTVSSFPRSGVGFALQFGADCPESDTDWNNALETVTVTKDYQILHSIPFWEFTQDQEDRCFRVADQKLNHLEFRVSQDRLEFYASDYDDPANLKLRTTVEGLDLPFERGYVHLQHAAYNAPKDGEVTAAQTFRWDNVGFDGPTYPAPRAYEVPDNDQDHDGRIRTAYLLMGGETQSFTLPGVDKADALAATFNFGVFAAGGQTLKYRLNAGGWHDFLIRSALGFEGTGKRTFSTPVALDELIDGDNTLEVKIAELRGDEMIGNIDLTVEAP